MNQYFQGEQFLFKGAPSARPPSIYPPPLAGKIPVAVQFIVPGLRLGNKNKNDILLIAKKCGIDLWDIAAEVKQNSETKQQATGVGIGSDLCGSLCQKCKV